MSLQLAKPCARPYTVELTAIAENFTKRGFVLPYTYPMPIKAGDFVLDCKSNFLAIIKTIK